MKQLVQTYPQYIYRNVAGSGAPFMLRGRRYQRVVLRGGTFALRKLPLRIARARAIVSGSTQMVRDKYGKWVYKYNSHIAQGMRAAVDNIAAGMVTNVFRKFANRRRALRNRPPVFRRGSRRM